MTEEQQRIAIAEACGWKRHVDGLGYYQGVHPALMGGRAIPDYLNNLNAMNEAVKSFFCSKPARDEWVYLENLQHVAGICHSSVCLRLVEASAAQRAEAFLRTIGKWTTNQPTEQTK
jgi:hypothetical protein